MCAWHHQAVCGLLGGAVGSLFIVLNTRVGNWRAKHIAPTKYRRVLEVACICAVLTSVAFWLPSAVRCTTASVVASVPRLRPPPHVAMGVTTLD